jgi:hypothetical protein
VCVPTMTRARGAVSAHTSSDWVQRDGGQTARGRDNSACGPQAGAEEAHKTMGEGQRSRSAGARYVTKVHRRQLGGAPCRMLQQPHHGMGRRHQLQPAGSAPSLARVISRPSHVRRRRTPTHARTHTHTHTHTHTTGPQTGRLLEEHHRLTSTSGMLCNWACVIA